MRDADRIQAINSEQLATATDRLLLRGGIARVRPPRSAQARLAPTQLLTPTTLPPLPRAPLAQGSQPHIVISPVAPARVARAQGSQPRIQPFDIDQLPYERTIPARRPRAQLSALTLLIPTAVGIALGIAALL